MISMITPMLSSETSPRRYPVVPGGASQRKQ
jgi:hypothetical protein